MIPLDYFSYDWFSFDDPLSLLHKYQRYSILPQPWPPRTPLRSTFHGATALILHPHLVFIIYLHNTLLDFSDLDYFLDGRSLPLIVILMWKTNGYRCNNKPEWGVEGVICCGNRTPAYLYNHHNQQLCPFCRLSMIFPQPEAVLS